MTIDSYDDIIDSRDVIARIEELEPFRVCRVSFEDRGTDADEDIASFKTQEEAEAFIKEEDYDPDRVYVDADIDEAAELRELMKLAEQGKDIEDWEYGVTLVRDSYFETYAEELASDLGMINKEAAWPLQFIDWEAAADALKEDYEELDFSGVTYWAR